MIIRTIYTFLLMVITPFFLIKLMKKKQGKPHIGKRWKEYVGITPKLESPVKPIWIHAVSVGEVIGITPLVKRLQIEKPDTPIVITTTTTTGALQVEKHLSSAEHRFMPFDLPFTIQHFLNSINPCQLIIMEMELWPNLLNKVSKNNIPITIINARLSDKSFQRYKKISFLFRDLSKNVHKIICQTKLEAERFIQLGVYKDKTLVSGSLKYDIHVSRTDIKNGDLLHQKIGTHRSIWIAASTHDGEEKFVLNAHKKILEKCPSALLILVPRHPERFNDVAKMCEDIELKTERRTTNQPITESTQVYLADTMGEMLMLMQASNVCFMGGSLIGSKVGGHNPLEPTALGLPVLTGPSYYNFNEIYEQLFREGIAQKVIHEQQLSDTVINLLSQSITLSCTRKKAKEFMKKHSGAIELTLEYILNEKA